MNACYILIFVHYKIPLFQSVALANGEYLPLYFAAVTLSHVKLVSGMRYYTQVSACDNGGLCTTVLSDGVIIDTSPPVIGDVIDGVSGPDIDYQENR